jgi:hypothetical protein
MVAGERRAPVFQYLDQASIGDERRHHVFHHHRQPRAAKHFFSSLSESFDETTTQIRSIVSGHDLERWLLKTLRAFAVSGNLGIGRQRLPGQLSIEAAFVEMLDDPLSWPDGAGLYCTMRRGDLATNRPRFRLQPLTNDCGEVAAITVEMMGSPSRCAWNHPKSLAMLYLTNPMPKLDRRSAPSQAWRRKTARGQPRKP